MQSRSTDEAGSTSIGESKRRRAVQEHGLDDQRWRRRPVHPLRALLPALGGDLVGREGRARGPLKKDAALFSLPRPAIVLTQLRVEILLLAGEVPENEGAAQNSEPQPAGRF